MQTGVDWFRYIVGLIVVLGAHGMTALLHFHEVPDNNRDVLNQAYGSIWTMTIMVVSWCFSSTKSNLEKDKLIASMSPAPPIPDKVSKPTQRHQRR